MTTPTEDTKPLYAFSERYAQSRTHRADAAREGGEGVSEEVVQCIWYDQMFRADDLKTLGGRRLNIVSPGWWNRGEGPDFKNAQIEFDGVLKTGDVEIHLRRSGWKRHGHHMDSRYDEVFLHVVLDGPGEPHFVTTSSGDNVPELRLKDYLEADIRELADELVLDDYPYRVEGAYGHCSALIDGYGSQRVSQLLDVAGEWRMLNKARALRRRIDQTSPNQAVYESFLTACGYSHFKYHFEALSRHLHIERVRQLGREDALLLETAFLQMAGLLPESLPEGTTAVPHFARLRALRRDRFAGLRSLPLEWRRVGVRPNNNPERRLAGAARLLVRTATKGLVETLDDIWSADMKPLVRRRAFEDLFLTGMGFWAQHCTWTGKRMAKPVAPLGPGRVRSIIGNVFIPAGLATARMDGDRVKEDKVFELFASLPQEPDNKIVRIMLPRIFADGTRPKLDFRIQQGLLQIHQDWCEPNPSCRNCRVIEHLNMSKPKSS